MFDLVSTYRGCILNGKLANLRKASYIYIREVVYIDFEFIVPAEVVVVVYVIYNFVFCGGAILLEIFECIQSKY